MVCILARAKVAGGGEVRESIVGKRYGMMVVIAKAERPADFTGQVRGTWWKCLCTCGKTRVFPRQYLTGGIVKSCGCIRRHPPTQMDKAAKSSKTPEQIREDKARAGRARAEQLRGKVTNFRMGGAKVEMNGEDRKMLDSISKKCKCAECGKLFDRLSSDWVYKTTKHGGRTRWFCSYTCWRAEDKKPRRPHGNSLTSRAAEG